ncbi:MAG: hypothetical protein JWM03_1308 [Rhodocyclales bacterium]|nr:hypothetical protein [Rhodocyclales bacterium]MDB5888436.1 hypothetical protein [Rhodocyclales bacterium]
MFRFVTRTLLALCLSTLLIARLGAQSAPTSEIQSAREAARTALQTGPRDIPLADQAVLKLPAGYGFVPRTEGARMMAAMGNRAGDDFMGMIVSDKLDGFVTVEYEKSGYIKDDDAKNWNADDLLKSLKEGTDEGNKDRAARGLPQIDIIGWVEKPAYEAATHRLVWSISTRDKATGGNAAPQDERGVNYNTYVLGREGYLSLDLVTDLSTIDAGRPKARELLAAVAFNKSKRYEDVDLNTDHIAEYGLAALVGGLAVKKLGLLAMAGVFLLKMWKLGAIALFGAGAAAKKWFGRDKGGSA